MQLKPPHKQQRVVWTRQARFAVLTLREREVLQWVVQGKSNGDIAGILGVALRTVKKHLERAFAKLNVHSRFEAMALHYESERRRRQRTLKQRTTKAVLPRSRPSAKIDEGIRPP